MNADQSIKKSEILSLFQLIGVIAAIAGVVAGLTRVVWIGDFEHALAEHSTSDREMRAGLADRISRIEEQCKQHTKWEEQADRIFTELHQFDAESLRQRSEIAGKIQQRDREDEAYAAAINRRLDWLEQQLRGVRP